MVRLVLFPRLILQRHQWLSFEDREKINFDHPRSIDFELLETHLKRLKSGKAMTAGIFIHYSQ